MSEQQSTTLKPGNYYCPRYQKYSGKFCQHWICNIKDKNDKIGFCKLQSYFRCIERIDKLKPHISNSQVRDWNICRRLYYLKHIMDIKRRPEQLGKPLKMGALWDLYQQYVYQEMDFQLINELINEYEIDEFDVAKVSALFKSHKKFIDPDYSCDCQVELQKQIAEDCTVKGIIDRLYDDNFFVESKLSSRPMSYLNVWGVTPQVGTYFLLDSNLEYVIMEVAQTPKLKVKKNENAEEFENRVFKDICTRPSHYFIGLDRDKGAFGKVFLRDDFNIERLKERYKIIVTEIKFLEELGADSFYQQETGCFAYGTACDFLPICENDDYISEDMFRIKEQETTQ